MQRVDDCDHSGAFLASATSANTVTYRINALGQRVQKIGAGTYAQPTSIPFAVTLSNPPTQAQLQALNTQVTAFYANTRFIYDEQGRLLGEYSKDGKLVEETVWFDNLPVAVLKPKGASATSPVSGTGNVATNNQDANNTGTNGNTAPPAAPSAKVNVEVFYVHPDHLGTPRVITASTALAATTGTGITSPQTVNKAVWRWDSDPFGSNATANSAPNENPNTLSQVVGTATLPYLFGFDLAFPGQKRDRETGKHYNYFRDYDPAVGRYFESDPIGLRGGVNTFGYVLQHPLNMSDPKGLLTAVEAYSHYCSGTGDPLTIGIGEVGISGIGATNFGAVRAGIAGGCRTAVLPIADSRAYTTKGDIWYVLGDVTLKLNGLLYTGCDCSWNFHGAMTVADDFYNFNPSTHRSFLGETITTIGRLGGKVCGSKPYTIKIAGSIPISERGRLRGSPTCCDGP